MGGGDGPPAVRLTGRAAARAGELGVRVAVSLTHSDTTAGAVAMGVAEPVSVPDWLDPLPDARADARDRPLGDRGARHPVARAHGARGRGARRA